MACGGVPVTQTLATLGGHDPFSTKEEKRGGNEQGKAEDITLCLIPRLSVGNGPRVTRDELTFARVKNKVIFFTEKEDLFKDDGENRYS